MSKFLEEDKTNFFIMVDSLKKCRRADLSDINEDENIIEALYTDPLESNWVLKSCLTPNTTILIGRKGTGKSTIIARIQHEIMAKKNKTEISTSESKIFFETSKPFTSHFYIEKGLENLLSTLELNFFLTKYNEQKDQDAKLMTFYYLNYGLCHKEDIYFGKGKDRKYSIQRRFNYSDIIKHYVQTAKEIKCKECGKVYPFEMLNSLMLFNMLCPTCKKGNCTIEHVKVVIPAVDKEIELPESDFKILHSLKIDEPQFASLLAQELDCFWQTVRSRVSILVGKDLIERKKETREERYGERTYYYLTEKAKNTYFNG